MSAPLQLRFEAIGTPADAERHVARIRFAEVLRCQAALASNDDDAVHAFRLACKRLRFSLERIQPQPDELAPAIALLRRLTDELGFAHDCAGLAELARGCEAPLVASRALGDRDRYVARAMRLWRRGFEENGAFAALASYARFRWSLA
jgi:CHAD domain-containing protein